MYFSGFSLQNEDELFNSYLEKSDFIVSGFSYGAQKAFEYTLNSSKRIDKLQMFSPAFFMDKDEKYKRLQLMYFKKDSQQYCENFLKNICYPRSQNVSKYFKEGTYKELEELLHYNWAKINFEKIASRGIEIEVFLGSEDKIINSFKAYEFFKEFATVYFIKEKGHIL